MEVKAIYRYARISPLKARDVARAVQGLPVSNALDMLQFTPKKAAFLIGKTLKSAVANAENNHDLSADDLIVKEATVNEGPAFKRWKARARGGAAPIIKRTAHISIILSDEGAQLRAEEEMKKAAAKKKTTAKKKTPAKKTAAKKEADEEKEAEVIEEDAPEQAAEETPKAEATPEPAEETKADVEESAAEEEPKAEAEASDDTEDTEKKG